jgi:hypothetical protein
MKGIFSANHSFRGGDRLFLLQIDLSSKIEGAHVSLERKPSVLEAGASCTLLSSRIELVFQGILPLTEVFQGGDRLCLLLLGLLS